MQRLKQLQKDNPLWAFAPHAKQQKIMASDAKYLWIFGGNRSGKTEINMYETCREWDGTHPHRWLKPRPDGSPCLVWMCSETSDVQRDTLQSKFDRFVPASWRKNKVYSRAGIYNYEILEVPNERYGKIKIKVVWKTYDQGARTYESASVDQIIADEEPPEDVYAAMEARLLDSKAWGNGYFKSALTPTEGKGWSIEKYWTRYEMGTLDPNIFVIKMSTYDNAHNLGGAEAVKQLESTYAEHERSARIYGDPRAKFGYVLDKYVDRYWPDGHLLHRFKPDWSVMTPWESIDEGYSAPRSIGFYAVAMNGEVYKYDEVYLRNRTIPQAKALIYHKRKEHGYHKAFATIIDKKAHNKESTGVSRIDQYASKDRNVWVGRGQEPTEALFVNLRKNVLDGKISQADYDKHVQAYQRKEGYISYPIITKEGHNERQEGWSLFNDYLLFDPNTKRPRFYVTDNCIEFRREARTAKFKPNADTARGKNVEGDDHAIDETRYMICERPFFKKNFSGIVDPARMFGEKEKRVRKY